MSGLCTFVVERVHSFELHLIFHRFLVVLFYFFFPRYADVPCPKCESESLVNVPAEIRLYRNRPRTLSHPPMNPPPDILVCLDCGWSEFSIPRSWLAAGWLRPSRVQAVPSGSALAAMNVFAATS